MSNTSAVYARIARNLKENAEEILSKLGVSPSSAIQMLYSQIVLTKGLPEKPIRRRRLTPSLQRSLVYDRTISGFLCS